MGEPSSLLTIPFRSLWAQTCCAHTPLGHVILRSKPLSPLLVSSAGELDPLWGCVWVEGSTTLAEALERQRLSLVSALLGLQALG